MHYLKETVDGRLVVIDSDYIFADGMRFPTSELWGVKGVFYDLEENAATAITSGIGSVFVSIAGFFLGIVSYFSSIFLVLGLILLVFGIGDSSLMFPFLVIYIGVVVAMKCIVSGTNKVVSGAASQKYYIIIVLRSGEHQILRGMPREFLIKVAGVLQDVINKIGIS